MKKILLVLIVVAFVGCKTVKENSNEIAITSKKEVVKDEYAIVINKVISDSRCPEGTNCVWAGELIMELSVWQNKELKDTIVMNFSYQNLEENKEWFSKYIPANKKLLKYKISPVKTEKQIELKEYKIDLILE